MIGFAVSTVAVILAAWLGYAAGRTHNKGHVTDHVPAGTSLAGWGDAPGGQTPERGQRIDSRVEQARLARVRRTIRDDPGHVMMCDCDRCLRAFGG